MSCDGVVFEEAYNTKIQIVVDDTEINFIDLDNLKKNKKAAGRPQDLADLDNLEPK